MWGRSTSTADGRHGSAAAAAPHASIQGPAVPRTLQLHVAGQEARCVRGRSRSLPENLLVAPGGALCGRQPRSLARHSTINHGRSHHPEKQQGRGGPHPAVRLRSFLCNRACEPAACIGCELIRSARSSAAAAPQSHRRPPPPPHRRGATIQRLLVTDRAGKLEDVVLGFDDEAPYKVRRCGGLLVSWSTGVSKRLACCTAPPAPASGRADRGAC